MNICAFAEILIIWSSKTWVIMITANKCEKEKSCHARCWLACEECASAVLGADWHSSPACQPRICFRWDHLQFYSSITKTFNTFLELFFPSSQHQSRQLKLMGMKFEAKTIQSCHRLCKFFCCQIKFWSPWTGSFPKLAASNNPKHNVLQTQSEQVKEKCLDRGVQKVWSHLCLHVRTLVYSLQVALKCFD